jgi:hypothetical protein
VRRVRIAVLVSAGLTCLAIVLPVSQAQKSEGAAALEKSIQPFFSKTCYVGHNALQKSESE